MVQIFTRDMALKKFKNWDSIDSSAVNAEEVEKSFTTVMTQAKAIESEYISRMIRQKAARFRKIAIAAAVAALFLLIPTTAWLFWGTGSTGSGLTCECSAPRGEIVELTLPDGSVVTLNAGSSISYPEKFGREREVTLSGEAIFSVSASRKSPFIVRTSDLCVKAYGTVFNVCNYSNEPSASATLCEGKISISRTDGTGRNITLEENQRLTYEKSTGATAVTRVKGDEDISWKDGEFSIRSSSLEKVLRMVERRYDVNIHLTTDAYSDAVLTAKFIDNEDIDQMMSALCKLVPGMNYTIEDKDIYIR